MNPQRRYAQGGFTLLEAIVTLIIVSMLVTVLMNALSQSLALRARMLRLQGEARRMLLQEAWFRDSLGGVQMTTAAWSAPQPFAPTAGCPAALAAGGSVQSVPTLADGALLALSALVLLAGLRLRRAAP